MICCPFPVNKAIFSGDFSIIAALPSLAEPTSMDSETNVFRFRAIAYASSMVEAYCNISLVRMEIGVADAAGRSDLAALMVTVRFIHAGKDTGHSGPSHGCEAISVFGLVKRNELVACKGVTHVEIEITADDKGRIGTVLTPAGK